MDLENKKVTVMGLGLLGGGVGATKWLARQGADVLVTDLKNKEELKPSLKELKDLDLTYVLGEHRPQDFKEADLIVKNPAVKDDSKFLKVARENDVPIETEMSLFFKFCPCPVIGITGTKGKSTTATLTYRLLKQNHSVILGGNIKGETLPQLEELEGDSLAVLELSSWQLSNLDEHQLSPHGAIITNIKQDHLNRYQSFEAYVEDKAAIYKHQQPNDFLLLNYKDPISSQFADSASAQVYYYNFEGEVDQSRGARLKNNSIVFQGEEICEREDIKIPGEHNLPNFLAAVTIAKIYGIENRTIKKVIANFEGLPHRLELVKQNGVSFYNDTCATNPAAAQAALNSFDRKVVLIAGGAEKNLDFKELGKTIAKRAEALLLLEGEATPRLKKAAKEALTEHNQRIPVNETESMEKAVRAAVKLAQPHGIVLLAPGCASFGQFVNEFDRGEKFKQAVNNLQ